jgi:phage anti-repressor protein
MNHDITLFCTVCEAETLHKWFEAEPELQLPEAWFCEKCDEIVFKEDIDCV